LRGPLREILIEKLVPFEKFRPSGKEVARTEGSDVAKGFTQTIQLRSVLSKATQCIALILGTIRHKKVTLIPPPLK